MKTPNFIGGIARILAILAAVGLLAGCGVDPSPVATTDEVVPAAKPPAGKGKDRTAESRTATSSTAESTTATSSTGELLVTRTATGKFYPDKAGELTVKIPNNYGSWQDLRVKEAIFGVQAGALDAVYDITMTVTSGYVIEDVKVDFAPGGIVFQPPARLTIKFWWGGDLSPAELELLEAGAQHITAEGTVTDMGFETDPQGNAYLNVIIEVPGFSRYGLCGDYYASGGCGGF